MGIEAYVICIIVVALLFDFSNGFNDAANSVATVVATQVLSPRMAVLWAAFFNFIAAFLFETRVATTIQKDIVHPAVMDPHVILAALIAAIAWTLVCTARGLPISVSHTLIGGLAGSAIVKAGVGALVWSKIGIVAAFIVLSPVIGLALAATMSLALMWTCRHWRSRTVDRVFRPLQLVSAAVYGLSHGLNDAQKTMGIISALLISVPALARYATIGRAEGSHALAWWIILSCHGAIALGTYIGGWKVVKTLGHKVTKLQPFHGFCAETGGGATIILVSKLGIPVSTTHTITGAIFGVGMMRGLRSVRWEVGRRIVIAWVLTLPASAALAAVLYNVVIIVRTMCGA